MGPTVLRVCEAMKPKNQRPRLPHHTPHTDGATERRSFPRPLSLKRSFNCPLIIGKKKKAVRTVRRKEPPLVTTNNTLCGRRARENARHSRRLRLRGGGAAIRQAWGGLLSAPRKGQGALDRPSSPVQHPFHVQKVRMTARNTFL